MSLKIVISVQRFDKIKHPPCAMIGEKEQEGGGFMIEKVYSGKERENQENVRIPKNIKQIGTTTSNKKIYIEDYVINRKRKAIFDTAFFWEWCKTVVEIPTYLLRE